jgi:hypothetical protein
MYAHTLRVQIRDGLRSALCAKTGENSLIVDTASDVLTLTTLEVYILCVQIRRNGHVSARCQVMGTHVYILCNSLRMHFAVLHRCENQGMRCANSEERAAISALCKVAETLIVDTASDVLTLTSTFSTHTLRCADSAEERAAISALYQVARNDSTHSTMLQIRRNGLRSALCAKVRTKAHDRGHSVQKCFLYAYLSNSDDDRPELYTLHVQIRTGCVSPLC